MPPDPGIDLELVRQPAAGDRYLLKGRENEEKIGLSPVRLGRRERDLGTRHRINAMENAPVTALHGTSRPKAVGVGIWRRRSRRKGSHTSHRHRYTGTHLAARHPMLATRRLERCRALGASTRGRRTDYDKKREVTRRHYLQQRE